MEVPNDMKRNEDAIAKARSLIEAHQYALDTDWSETQPSPDAENAMIDRNGWDGFADWHLAIDPDASEETKDRFAFPYGDFRRVHRSGLIAAKQRAAQHDYQDIEQAADELLDALDAESSN